MTVGCRSAKGSRCAMATAALNASATIVVMIGVRRMSVELDMRRRVEGLAGAVRTRGQRVTKKLAVGHVTDCTGRLRGLTP